MKFKSLLVAVFCTCSTAYPNILQTALEFLKPYQGIESVSVTLGRKLKWEHNVGAQRDKVFYITNALYGLADAHARDEWWPDPVCITVDLTLRASAQISKAHIFPAVSCSNTKEAETKMPKMVRINGHLVSFEAQPYDANLKIHYDQM